jgi:autotransporter-associated beta strand protein
MKNLYTFFDPSYNNETEFIIVHRHNKTKNKKILSAFTLIGFIFFMPYFAIAQQTSFSTGFDMLTPANYSLGVLPTNTNDVLLTTSSNILTISTNDLTMRSLNVTNGSAYTIGPSSLTTAHKLTIGNPVSYTNAFGILNDIFYLNNNSSLTVQPTNLGTKILGITLASSGNFDITTGSTLTINAVITDAGNGYSITKNGGGTLALSGVNTYTGITINGGVVSTTNGNTNFGTYPTGVPVSNYITINGGTIQAAGSITFSPNRGFTLGSSGGTFDNNGFTITNAAAITGTGSFTQIGSGTFNNNLAATYTGNTFIQQGTLKDGLNNSLPTTTIVYLGQAATANLGTYDVNNKTQTIAGINSVAGTNILGILSNTVTNSAGTINVLTIGGAGNYTLGNGSAANSGLITGNVSLNMAGSGLQTLGGVNSYAGNTVFTSGELRFSLPAGSAQSLAKAVFSGGKLGTKGSAASTSLTFSSITMTSSSAINLDTSVAHNIIFTSGAVTFSSNQILTITGWRGGYNGTAGTMGRIYIGNTAGLSAGNLALIQFSKSGVIYSAVQLATGEIVPGIIISVTTTSISGSSICAGASGITVNFTYAPVSNFVTATFIAQLSDASGSFATPVNLQSVIANSTGAQSIPITIPTATPAGSGYKIRVVSTFPPFISTAAAATLTVTDNNWIGGAIGNLTNWNTASNWCNGIVPDINTNVIISSATNYPTVTATAYANNITINNGVTFIIASGGVLHIHGTIINNGVFNATAGSLEMAGSSPQSIGGSMFVSSTINNLIDSNTNTTTGLSIAASNPLNITGRLGFGYTNAILTTNDELALVSNALTTASVGQIAVNGSGLPLATINGNVTVQRYYPAHRRWRFVTVPVQSSGAPSINAAWQEGAQSIAGSISNPHPGFGTHVSGPTVGPFVSATGYDQSATNSASIAYLADAVSWYAVPNTFIAATTYQGYMLFVRGDRSFPVFTSRSTTPATSTVLRTTGVLNTGKVTVPVNTGFTVIGNPYAATINFNNVYNHAATTSAVTSNSFSLWDPNIGSAANVASGTGGWVTLSWNAGTSAYDASPNPQLFDGFDVNGDIQSGAAFAVNGSGSGSVEIDEADKVTGTDNHLYLFKPEVIPAPANPGLLRTTLYATDTSHTIVYLADGVLNIFDSSFSDTLSAGLDIKKLFSFNERVSILKFNENLSIQKSPLKQGDTIHLIVGSLKQVPYQFLIQTTSFNRPDLNAFWVDSFTNISTPIPLKKDTSKVYINFTINPDVASSFSPTRFSVVFKPAPSTTTYNSVTALLQDKNILVDWTVKNQLNVAKYIVEKSTDNINFYPVDTTVATTDTSAIYNWLDVNGVVGENYYRIRSIGNRDTVQYSKTVDVIITKPVSANVATIATSNIIIYPNPVTGRILYMQMSNMPVGTYDVKIVNASGQILSTQVIEHSILTETQPVFITNDLSVGIYMLEITDPNKKTTKINFKK